MNSSREDESDNSSDTISLQDQQIVGDNLKNRQIKSEKNQSLLLSKTNQIPQVNKQQQKKLITVQQQQKLKIKKHRTKRFNLQQLSSSQQQTKPKTPHYYQQPTLPTTPTKLTPKLGPGHLPSNLLLTTWNINGIRFSISKNHLSYYINQTKPDILCLTQTKMDQFSYLKQPIEVFGFNSYWNFCKCSSGYSGVVVFSKYQPMRVIEGIPQNADKQIDNESLDIGEDFDKQGRVLTLQFKQFFLVTAYIPSAGKQLQRLNYKCKQFQPRFFSFCQKLIKLKPTIIAGDLNTALTQLDTHMTKNTPKNPAFTLTQRQSLQKFIKANNLIDCYRFKNPTKKQFTWWHIKYFGREYAIGKRLDYFLLPGDSQKAIVSCQIKEKFRGSDHSPVQLKLDMRKMIGDKKQLQEEQE